MNTYQYEAYVADLSKLKTDLVGGGFDVVAVSARVSTPPVLYVHANDGETRESDIGTFVAPYDLGSPVYLSASSDKSADVDGVAVADADGVAVHTVTIKKVDQADVDVTTGSEDIRVLPDQFIGVDDTSPQLSSGTVDIVVGPSSVAGTVTVAIEDASSPVTLNGTAIKLRFG